MRILVILFACLFAAGPVVGAGEKRKTYNIKMRKGLMRYKVESIFAKPGEKIRIVLDNNDEIQHNLVICAKGKDTWKEVADAALKIGEKALERGWVPESPLVLAATKLVDPAQKDTLDFDVPMEPGIYPYVCTFPGHAQLMRGVLVVADSYPRVTDMRFDYHEGEWSNLAEFAKSEPVHSGKMEKNRISLDPRKRNDQFGFVFTADVNAPIDAEYQFHLASDDGSQILIDGKPVITLDGVHGAGDLQTGKVNLEAGSHRFELRYFEKDGGEDLRVAWSGPGFERQALTDPRFIQATIRREEMELRPVHEIMVVRCNLPQAPPTALAVGTPLGIHYCFDPTTCRVLYMWAGEFLDVGPERGDGKGRGGRTCKVMGDIFEITDGERFPLAFESNDLNNATPKFLGYKRSAKSTKFFFRLGDVRVQQSISIRDDVRPSLSTTYRFDGVVEGKVTAQYDPDRISVVAFSFGGAAHGGEGELIWNSVEEGVSMMIFPKAP